MSNDQAAHNAFGDLVHTVQLSGEAGLAGEVDHGVDAFLLVVDRVGQTALAPLVDRIDRTVSSIRDLNLPTRAAEASSSRAALVISMVSYFAIL